MSNYQMRLLHSERLNNLFTELEQETFLYSSPESIQVSGWTWECDFEGLFINCAPEVTKVLGIKAEDFIGKPIAG